MRSRFRETIFIPGLEEKLSKSVDSTSKPGMEQAMEELNQVLKHCTREVTDCIPKEFYDFLDRYRDKDWEGNLDFSQNLNDMDLLHDTRFLLSMVYRDFLCSDEERKNMVEKEQRNTEEMGMNYRYVPLMDLIRSGGQ